MTGPRVATPRTSPAVSAVSGPAANLPHSWIRQLEIVLRNDPTPGAVGTAPWASCRRTPCGSPRRSVSRSVIGRGHCLPSVAGMPPSRDSPAVADSRCLDVDTAPCSSCAVLHGPPRVRRPLSRGSRTRARQGPQDPGAGTVSDSSPTGSTRCARPRSAWQSTQCRCG